MAKYQSIGHSINLPLWMSPRFRWRQPAIPLLLFLMVYFYLPTKYKQYLLSSNNSCRVNPLSDREAADDVDTSVTFLPHIPPKIWQHIIPQQYLDVNYLKTEASIHNRKHKFRGNHLPQDQSLLDPVQLYNAIPRPVMKADLVRYALLAAEGGVYSDSDTSPVHPLRQWAPKELRSHTRLIVGIEADSQPPVPGTTYPVQVSQWTIAGAKGHPVLWRMIRRVLSEVRRQTDEAEKPHDEQQGPEVVFSNDDVLRVSGPAGWTEEIYGYISEVTATEFTWKNLTGLENPTLFGDVLVLPINAFATGVPHSGSSQTNVDATMVRHYFSGSWKNQS
ncbi:initiation-specific alpha- -mannosyltransferase [Colletotrichum incanum]|uniref:Initiation-specific alpha--mannosyltransferase n=1 Tax=Colletotrichum incanum TaxID=1573173 RepID=A0A161Y204_COLIC|nr:initiation-specific alpha- -mannosyltransferase [Colletotrichum incanum]